MGELRIWKGAGVLTAARGAEALKERTMAERNMVNRVYETSTEALSRAETDRGGRVGRKRGMDEGRWTGREGKKMVGGDAPAQNPAARQSAPSRNE